MSSLDDGKSEKNEDNVGSVNNNSSDDKHANLCNNVKDESSSNLQANFYREEITSDDEILTFQCPKDFNVSSLLNKELNLSGETNIEKGKKKYSCQVLTNHKEMLTCAVPTENRATLVRIPVTGHVIIRKVLNVPDNKVERVINDNSKSAVQPLTHVKRRHPLLGSEWDDYLQKVKKQIEEQKRLLKKNQEVEKSLENAAKQRKERKRKLKDELHNLKKKKLDTCSS